MAYDIIFSVSVKSQDLFAVPHSILQ